MTLEKVADKGSYYIYKKYFVNKFTTLSLYQRSFINNTVDKIK